MKNVSLLQSEELRRKTTKVKKQQLMEDKEYQRTLQHLQAQLEGTGTEEEFGSSQYQEKTKGL